MNISITGNLGSGRKAICKELEKLGFQIISAGKLFREIAQEKGISVIELNRLVTEDDEVDKLLDAKCKMLGNTMDKTVFDAKMAWYFVPDSLKVFIDVASETAANRMMQEVESSAEGYSSREECLKDIEHHKEFIQARFHDLYQVDCLDMNNFDLVIDSTSQSAKEIADKIICELDKRQ